mgnify:CR=1 FL=1
MTLKEIIKASNALLKRFTTEFGVVCELYTTQRSVSPMWSAEYWQIVNGKQVHLFAIAHGDTEEEGNFDDINP